MADVYSQIYIQIVMTPKGRHNLIQEQYQNEIFSYISGTITSIGHKSIIVNGMPDHVHMFIGLNPSMAISDLVREVKKSSNRFINQKGFMKRKFYWQNGYGVFSYGRSQI